ncbi:MAG: OmpP1/FadL family transporter [Acidobacteriota bacterium]
MKKIIIWGHVVLLLFASPLLMANGLNLNGLGARAISMGGAFVGLADDYSAVFWNPAGIACFKNKTLGFSGDLIMPSSTYELEMLGMTLIDAQLKSNTYPSGIAAYYHPITDKLVAGIGIYTPSGLGAEWEGSDFFVPVITPAQSQPYKQKSFIGVVTISPAAAYQVSDAVSVGASLNINYGFFNLNRWAGAVNIPMPPYVVDLGQYEEESSGWGVGATLGVLVEPSDRVSLGLTFRTPTKVSMSGEASIYNFSLLGYPGKSEFDREVTYPMWIAGGLAFHPIESLTFTLDAQYTNWAKLDELETEFKDTIWQAAMAGTAADVMELQWEDAVQIRFGAEYLLDKVAFRAGYYYDPAPAPDKTMNILIPSYTFNAFTFGIGYEMDGLHVDAMLEYLVAKERNVAVNEVNQQPGIYNMSILTPGLSISYRW